MSNSRYFLELDLSQGMGEHYFQYLWGYLLPGLDHLHNHDLINDSDAHIVWHTCGPVMDGLTHEVLANYDVSYTIEDPKNLNMDSLKVIEVSTWDKQLKQISTLQENYDGISRLQPLYYVWKWSKTIKQRRLLSASKWIRDHLIQKASEQKTDAELEPFHGKILILDRSDMPDFYKKSGTAARKGYGVSRRSLQGVEAFVAQLNEVGIPAMRFEPGVHDLMTQIRAFHLSNGIVGIRGAEFSNMLWLEPGRKAIMIETGNFKHPSPCRSISYMYDIDYREIHMDHEANHVDLNTIADSLINQIRS